MTFTCPLPKTDYTNIQMAHGSGGKLSEQLLRDLFLPCFSNPELQQLEDQAVVNISAQRIAFSTDTFVVQPIFFPGGDIGELAVNGTVNDIAVSGATPRYLSAGFILEEGLSIAELHRVLLSMRRAADRAGVTIITGDTKVVPRGFGDKVYINTAGIGVFENQHRYGTHRLSGGQKLIITGTVADHGMAVLTAREGLSFESEIKSDTAALNDLISKLREQFPDTIKAMRDPTRGGVAATLNEWASAAGVMIRIHEQKIPIHPAVQSACELLGIDPLHVANEGKLIISVDASQVEEVLTFLRRHPLGREATVIGEIVKKETARVVVVNPYGVERLLPLPINEQLPRIC